MRNAAEITARIAEWRSGDEQAFDTIIPVVYEDLRSIARQQLARLRPNQTLDTTALVNESYAKLRSGGGMTVRDRDHFFAIAACAMRQIIVDEARSLMTGKRSGTKVDLDKVPQSLEEQTEQLVLIDQLLEHLESINPELVRLIECRFYAGLTQEETAEALGISLRTAQRRWQQANAWMRRLLEDC